jgi:hypothetical protein
MSRVSPHKGGQIQPPAPFTQQMYENSSPEPPMMSHHAKPQQQQSQVVEKCQMHFEDVILLCLKDSEKICARCLHSTHLLHPVVPLGSLDQLDFQKSLKQEIETSLKEIQEREPVLNQSICDQLRRHKINLRNHIIFIRDNLREEFDEFFNNLLHSIRKDWNLFTV